MFCVVKLIEYNINMSKIFSDLRIIPKLTHDPWCFSIEESLLNSQDAPIQHSRSSNATQFDPLIISDPSTPISLPRHKNQPTKNSQCKQCAQWGNLVHQLQMTLLLLEQKFIEKETKMNQYIRGLHLQIQQISDSKSQGKPIKEIPDIPIMRMMPIIPISTSSNTQDSNINRKTVVNCHKLNKKTISILQEQGKAQAYKQKQNKETAQNWQQNTHKKAQGRQEKEIFPKTFQNITILQNNQSMELKSAERSIVAKQQKIQQLTFENNNLKAYNKKLLETINLKNKPKSIFN